jgi:hypothetical protein
LVSKATYTVFSATPASAAIAPIVVLAYPCASNSRWAASRMSVRVAAACARRREES